VVIERGARAIVLRPAPVIGLRGSRSVALPEFDPSGRGSRRRARRLLSREIFRRSPSTWIRWTADDRHAFVWSPFKAMHSGTARSRTP